jgi:hypothetical protein
MLNGEREVAADDQGGRRGRMAGDCDCGGDSDEVIDDRVCPPLHRGGVAL